jgi:hypothetical protein
LRCLEKSGHLRRLLGMGRIEKVYGATMIVYLEHVSGTAKDNLDRAKVEIERIVGFRGTVTEAKVQGRRIAVTFEVNPK